MDRKEEAEFQSDIAQHEDSLETATSKLDAILLEKLEAAFHQQTSTVIYHDLAKIDAFDKQFCVNYNGDVFYKEIKVGVVDNNAIKFEDKYSYLEIVLEDNYEKTSRTFRATPL